MVDPLGLILGVLVTPANVSDPAGAAILLPGVVGRLGRLRRFRADGTYGGLSILAKLRGWFLRRGLHVEIVRAQGGGGSQRLRGPAQTLDLIERTFAWLTQNRRFLIAASKLVLKRLSKRLY